MMTGFIEQYGALIVLFPLLGAVLNGLFGRHIQKRYGETPIGLIASCSVLLSSMFAAAAFVALATSDETRIISHLYTWIDVGSAKAEVSFLFDALSTVMILIVTGVGFLIHVYSTGYMKNDTGYYRFFSYLNLFVFFMLVLVLSENLLLLFIGWEGVGLCSYLLISFWYEERKNCLAGNKAFIVNRAGDFGFLLGILLLFRTLSSGISSADAAAGHVQSFFSFQYMSEHVHLIKDMELFGVPVVTIICLCLFLGVTGKSAQVPLHVWLPDAMAGPTPVSALIHAATMVTAGVYLIGRLHFLFSMSTAALNVITWTGALTALLGATMGCVQHDIKKVLAYSTVSQLGMMVMAMGVEAYGAGIFHLATHAFFKACLFLGAGSVIIAMHHEQDMHRMGGLRKYMPVTFKTFVISALAISGIPPLSGFFSKDEILWNAWSHGGMALWIAGIIAAALTAFYMTRLVVLVFYGERPRAEAEDAGHAQDHPYRHPPKEPPHVITTPLLLLATLSAVSGFIGIPASLGGRDLLGGVLKSVFVHHIQPSGHSVAEYVGMIVSVVASLAGIASGIFLYLIRPDMVSRLATRLRALHRLVFSGYFIDAIYNAVFVSGIKGLTRLASGFDRYVVDLLVNTTAYILMAKAYLSSRFDLLFIDRAVGLVADATVFAGGQTARLQTGRVQAYVLLFFLLITALVAFLVLIS